MVRPTNKKDLLKLSTENFNKLLLLVSKIPETVTSDLNGRDKNVRDVICHLHEWHLMTIKWYQDGMLGIKPNMPAPNYTWKTTKELNKVIWEKYQTISLDIALNLIKDSHNEIFKLIEKHNEEELFIKKHYLFTNTTSLASWFISATSSHYDWAIKLLKKLCPK